MAELNTKGLRRAARQSAREKPDVVEPGKGYAPPVRSHQVPRGVDRSLFGLTGKLDPERITFAQMHQMHRDPMIKLGLHYARAPIVNAVWGIECRDRQIAAFVENALKEIYVPLLMGILTKNPFGFAAMAKRFELAVPDWTYLDEDGQEQDVWPDKNLRAVVWRSPQIIRPELAVPVISKATDEFLGIRAYGKPEDAANAMADAQQQYLDGATDLEVTVPAKYALWATNELQDSFGNMFGYPRTGYAFRYWWSYWYRWMLGDRHFEADADPPLVIGYPTGETVDPETEEEISHADVALQVGNDLRDGATVAMPTDVYVGEDGRATNTPQWTADFLKGGENMQAFQDSYDYMDLMKLRSLLVPDGAIMQTRGSSSGAEKGSSWATVFVESQAIEMGEIDQLINRHLIPQLVQQNFADAPPCRKVTKRFRSDDLTLAQDVIKLIANVSPKDLGLDVYELVRSVGLPQITSPNVEPVEDGERGIGERDPEQTAPGRGEPHDFDPTADPRGKGGLDTGVRPHE